MTDVWESEPLIEEVWQSDTTPGVQWVTVVREGESPGGGGGSPTGGAGGFLSGTYPNPGVNSEALQDAVGAMAGAGLSYDDTAGVINADVGAGVAPIVADIVLAVAAVDGSATVFEIIEFSDGAAASGVVPADWVSVFTVPDVATFQGLLASVSLTTVVALVPGEDAVYRFLAAEVDEPWADITPDPGVMVFGSAAADYWRGRVTPEGIEPDLQNAAAVPYEGSGLFSVNSTVQTAIDNAEGTLDRIRVVAAFATTNVDLSTYVDVESVTVQPTLEAGTQPAQNEDVWLFGQTDPAENGCYLVEAPSGAWVKYSHPAIFDPRGNGYRVFVNSPGSAAHGTIFMWLDADQSVKHRGSGTYPGSGDGGEFVRYAAPSSDLTTAPGGSSDGWQTLHVVTLAEALGTAASPLSYDVTGYNHFKVTVRGSGVRNSTLESVRMRINANDGNVYGTDTATLVSSLALGNLPGNQTNTDRQGQLAVEFGGASGFMKSGRSESTGISSTSTVGAADTDVGLFSDITAAITSIQLFGNNAALAVGTFILIEGIA